MNAGNKGFCGCQVQYLLVYVLTLFAASSALDSGGGVFPILPNAKRSDTLEFIGRIERNVTGAGYHRKMTTLVVGAITNGFDSIDKCRFLLVENVSRFMYYDLDELRMQKPFGGVAPHALVQSIDVEKPAAVSEEHIIGLEVPQNNVHITRRKESNQIILDVVFEVVVPFHLRYQAASWKTHYNNVTISLPKGTYFTCNNNDGGNDSNNNNFNEWKIAEMQGKVVPIAVYVPVGSMSHQKYVGVITLFMAMGGAVYILFNMK
jgi:hypothetical protein